MDGADVSDDQLPKYAINFYDSDFIGTKLVGTPVGLLPCCNDCGAMVLDVALHEAFHRRLRVQLGLI